MNYFRQMNSAEVTMHFFVATEPSAELRREIEGRGGRVVMIPKRVNLPRYLLSLFREFKRGEYDVVHANLTSLNILPLSAAWIAGVKVRISHARSTSNSIDWCQNLAKTVLRPFSHFFATHYFACSICAGRWLFGRKLFDRRGIVIPNVIDGEHFRFDPAKRDEIRRRYGLEGKFVIGHVGRLTAAKNHRFLLEIISNLIKKTSSALSGSGIAVEPCLMLVGDGELRGDIRRRAKKMGIADRVIRVGFQSDPASFYSAMDVFVFPSIFEGFGMALLEAQANGLPCIASTEVPREAAITDNVKFLSLGDDLNSWINSIISSQRATDAKFSESYCIQHAANKLMLQYQDIANKDNRTHNVSVHVDNGHSRNAGEGLMKTALLHYWLTNLRGGEKVFAALGEILPGADVYTHAFRNGKWKIENGKLVESCVNDGFFGHPVRESWIAKLPMGRRIPQAYVWLMPYASRMLDLREYDLIVSSESGPIKGITKRSDQRHVCYCHSPMRYVWDMYDQYYAAADIGGKIAMKIFRKHLQYHDLKSVDSVDEFIANSNFIAERIRRIYGRASQVVHPPVDVEFYKQGLGASCPEVVGFESRDYYLYAGELRNYKRPDLAVEACARMGRKLVVVGNGKLRKCLQKQVADNPNIKFLGHISDDELRATYANAKALLFPGIEDFGIVPVETQATGTPVIALGKGGALDSVVDGKTGLFFKDESVDGLCGAIEEFESRSWSPQFCQDNTTRFCKSRFVTEMKSVLKI